MVVVPLSKPANAEAAPLPAESCNLVTMAAAASLAAGGALVATGNRRAGLVVAAAGTALIMVDQKETVRRLWNSLPGYLAELQDFLGHVQSALDDLSSQRERLHKIFRK
jgi:hypothetical protein